MWQVYVESLVIMLSMGLVTWLISLKKNDVSIVDSLWSMLFLVAGLYVFVRSPVITLTSSIIMLLLAIWAIRLSVFLILRNWGEPEDRRYQVIRHNNSPGFGIKSLYLVFGLQSLLAWIIFIGLLPGLYAAESFGWIHMVAVALWLTGFFFESIADWQLYEFRVSSEPGDVLQTGLWRYTRHPNYFGEFLIWWAFFLMTVTTVNWWVIMAPLIMTILLLKVSGIGLMEQGITTRRPNYQAYIDSTSAFFPWKPRSLEVNAKEDLA